MSQIITNASVAPGASVTSSTVAVGPVGLMTFTVSETAGGDSNNPYGAKILISESIDGTNFGQPFQVSAIYPNSPQGKTTTFRFEDALRHNAVAVQLVVVSAEKQSNVTINASVDSI